MHVNHTDLLASGMNSLVKCVSKYLFTHLVSHGLKPTRLVCGQRSAGDVAPGGKIPDWGAPVHGSSGLCHLSCCETLLKLLVHSVLHPFYEGIRMDHL